MRNTPFRPFDPPAPRRRRSAAHAHPLTTALRHSNPMRSAPNCRPPVLSVGGPLTQRAFSPSLHRSTAPQSRQQRCIRPAPHCENIGSVRRQHSLGLPPEPSSPPPKPLAATFSQLPQRQECSIGPQSCVPQCDTARSLGKMMTTVGEALVQVRTCTLSGPDAPTRQPDSRPRAASRPGSRSPSTDRWFSIPLQSLRQPPPPPPQHAGT